MLKITIPSNLSSQRQYILNVLLTEFLGISFSTETKEINNIQILYENKRLTIADIFFNNCHWLQPESMPSLPLKHWNVIQDIAEVNLVLDYVPVIFADKVYFKPKSDGLYLGLDIFGSAFFMLSRYEEAIKPNRDTYNRFPASASIAYKAGFLDRPIIDEYVEILWAAMKRVWPRLQRKKRDCQISFTCDVDQPYSPHIKSVPLTIKKIAGDIIKRKNINMALKSAVNSVISKFNKFNYEPNHTFDWIMDINERAGNKVMFNFIAGSIVDGMDGVYSLDEKRIQSLMRHIHERGHEIGLHGSYGSYNSVNQLSLEANRLRKIMDEERIYQNKIGNRQHYLRWSILETARNLELAGIDYDTTLGYADYPGYRCGTSFEYPMYDLINRKPLKLKQKPLILMECSVLDDNYLGFGLTDKALEFMLTLKKRSLKFGGNFVLLWHNDNLIEPAEKQIFKVLVS
jgi:peptidoglycan/xylan/chitin deacetylase (PgdA/CDA1 family)